MNPNWSKSPPALGKGTIRQSWIGARTKAQHQIGWSVLLAGLGTIAIAGSAVAAVKADRVQVEVTPDQWAAHSALLGSPTPQQLTLNSPEVVGAGVYEPRTLDHGGPVSFVTVSADGSTVITRGESGLAKVWAAGHESRTLDHGSHVWDVAVSADGSTIVTGSHNGTAKVWAGSQESLTLDHGGTLWDVAVSADGSTIVTGGTDGTATVWTADQEPR